MDFQTDKKTSDSLDDDSEIGTVIGNRKEFYSPSKETFCSSAKREWIILGPALFVIVASAVLVLCLCLTGNCGQKGICSLQCEGSEAYKWGYTIENGPQCWSKCFPQCGSSRRQSPVNFRSSEVEVVSGFRPLNLANYTAPFQNALLLNDGHTAILQPSLPVSQSMEGLGLPGRYIPVQLHWHWGSLSSQGSEHTINGREYPMELHVVHYSANYSSLEEAQIADNGLAVLGFMYEIGPVDNPRLESITNSLQHVKYAGQMHSIAEIVLAELLPDGQTSYYRYFGSLTSPPCLETVVWTVFTDTIQISERQLSKFRELLANDVDSASEPLVDIYRPPLEVGTRSIYLSGNP